MIVLSNASPLITLAKIESLDLLPSLFGEIVITPEVRAEVVVEGSGLPGSVEILLARWIRVDYGLAGAEGAYEFDHAN